MFQGDYANLKLLIIIGLLGLLIFVNGCWVYGEGKTYGYITTVEDGIIWDKVRIRAELESSQTDCYVIDDSKNSDLQEDLRVSSINKNRIELSFKRHLWTASSGCNNDEVIGFRIVENEN